MKKFITLMMSLLVALTLTACSSGDSIDGKYELSKIEYDGKTYEEGDSEWTAFMAAYDSDVCYLELDDGEASVNLFGETGEGTYEVDGSTVTITIDGDSQDFDYEDGTLSATSGSFALYFSK